MPANKSNFLCVSNETIKGKLDSTIRQPSNQTTADQLAAIVQLNSADYEHEINKTFPRPTLMHDSAFIKDCLDRLCHHFNNSNDQIQLTSLLMFSVPLYWQLKKKQQEESGFKCFQQFQPILSHFTQKLQICSKLQISAVSMQKKCGFVEGV